MDEAEKTRRLHGDPDFILTKRFNYSVAEALRRYPDGLRDDLVEQALGLEGGESLTLYQKIVRRLRRLVG